MKNHEQNKKTNKIKCTGCFKSLGIDARIQIYVYLRDNGEKTVTELVKLVGLTQPTVSYHLKEMRELGLLESRRSGKEVLYKVSHECGNTDCVLDAVKFTGVRNAGH